MDLSQLFTNMLTAHENRLYNLGERFRRQLITEEALNAAFYNEESSWRDFLMVLRSYYNYDKVISAIDLTDEQKEQYKHPDPQFPLCGLLEYRGQVVPMYDDDYGQQVFAIFRGRDLVGGAYNMWYCDSFIDEIDYALDHEIAFNGE